MVEIAGEFAKGTADVNELGKAELGRQPHALFPAEIDRQRFQFQEEPPLESGTRESLRIHPQHPIFEAAKGGR